MAAENKKNRCLKLFTSLCVLTLNILFLWEISPGYKTYHEMHTLDNMKERSTRNKYKLVMQGHDFHDYVTETNTNESKNSEQKLIVWYNVPHWWMQEQGLSIENCPIRNCVISANRSLLNKANAVLVHGPIIRSTVLPEDPDNKTWIFYGLEPPVKYLKTYMKPIWRHRFDLTMTFRIDSDIPVPYGRLVFTEAPKSVNFNQIVNQKSKPVAWFASQCHTMSRRGDYVRELQKYVDVDIYGKCGSLNCSEANDNGCLQMLNTTYKFYLAFENSLCVDYVSEKFFKTFNTTVVPVVRGGAAYERLFPKNIFINVNDFESPRHLGQYLNYLDKNHTAYIEILREKSQYRPFDIRHSNMSPLCRLCERLNRNYVTETAKRDIHEWLTMAGKACILPNDLKT